jgi:hypothetical protein
VLPFQWNNDHLPKVVREDREKYKRISQLLDDSPEILDRVHGDLKKLSQGGRKGRDADFTSETILRALVVHAMEGLSFRETVILIAGSDFLQDFLRTRKKAVMDFTFLDKCLLAIRPQTWRRVNELLGHQAVAAERVDPSVIRTDTTVVESNVHWPTDSSLLWDTWQSFRAGIRRHCVAKNGTTSIVAGVAGRPCSVWQESLGISGAPPAVSARSERQARFREEVWGFWHTRPRLRSPRRAHRGRALGRRCPCPSSVRAFGGFVAQLRLPDLATRLQGLAVAPDRPRWVYASLANLGRGAPPSAVSELPFPALVVNTDARKPVGSKRACRSSSCERPCGLAIPGPCECRTRRPTLPACVPLRARPGQSHPDPHYCVSTMGSFDGVSQRFLIPVDQPQRVFSCSTLRRDPDGVAACPR